MAVLQSVFWGTVLITPSFGLLADLASLQGAQARLRSCERCSTDSEVLQCALEQRGGSGPASSSSWSAPMDCHCSDCVGFRTGSGTGFPRRRLPGTLLP